MFQNSISSTSCHRAVKSALLLSTFLIPHAAHADDASGVNLAFNVGVVSDYRVRGIAQTSRKPALQAGADLSAGAWYLGTAASNVNWVKDLNGATKGDYEVDFYAGYRSAVADTGFSYDFGVVNYRFPGNNSGVQGFFPAGTYTNANTVEAYGALTYGFLTFKYNRSLGNFLGTVNSEGSQYFDLSANFDLGEGFTLTPHMGRQLIPNQVGNLGDYSDFSLALGKNFGSGLTGTVTAMTTNANKTFYTDTKGEYLGNKTIVVGLKYSF